MRKPKEYKVVSLRETATTEKVCDTPQQLADYWRESVATANYHDPMKEMVAVVMLDTRKRVIGHALVSIGLLDQCAVHAREVFRPAIVKCAHSIALIHNHPSGDPTPSEADVRVTSDIQNAGKLLRLPLVDHVVVGGQSHTSIRETGGLLWN